MLSKLALSLTLGQKPITFSNYFRNLLQPVRSVPSSPHHQRLILVFPQRCARVVFAHNATIYTVQDICCRECCATPSSHSLTIHKSIHFYTHKQHILQHAPKYTKLLAIYAIQLVWLYSTSNVHGECTAYRTSHHPQTKYR